MLTTSGSSTCFLTNPGNNTVCTSPLAHLLRIQSCARRDTWLPGSPILQSLPKFSKAATRWKWQERICLITWNWVCGCSRTPEKEPPWPCVSVGWSTVPCTRKSQDQFRPGHMPRLPVWSQVRMCKRGLATNGCFSLTRCFPVSLPSLSKSNGEKCPRVKNKKKIN